jgi:DHA1 family multidrug resistance protein-like MFS transporter
MDLRQREFIGLSAAGLFTYFSYALSRSPIIPLYAQSLGASPQLIGWVVAASTITGIAVKLPAGTLSDHLGRRAILIVGACFFAFTPFFYIFATSVVWLLILRIIHGNATAVFSPTASAAISDITDPSRRGIRLGLYSSLQGIGQALGPLLGGVLISWQGYSVPFVVSGVVGCVGLAIVLGTFRERKGRPREAASKMFFRGIREGIRNRGVVTTSLTVSTQMFAVGAYNAFLPLYSKGVMGLDAWHVGAVFAIQITTTLLARPFMGRVSDSVGRKPVIVVAVIWSAALLILLPAIPSFELLLVFGSAWGLGLSVVSSVASAFITDLAHSAHYGAAHGVFGTVYDIGEASGPIVAGVLTATFGYSKMFTCIGGFLFVIALVFAGTRLQEKSESRV